MNTITRKALASVALTEHMVCDIFDSSTMMSREKLIEQLQRLCTSHERLRIELNGAEILIEENKHVESR
jgi:hypothetical protein